MNEKETRELIKNLITSPSYCIFCGGLLEDYGKTDSGYSMTRCRDCGKVFNEE